MSSRELFAGYGLNAIDAKGRVAIPSCLRAAIEANSAGRTLVLAKHPNDPCLIGYDREWLKVLDGRLDAQESQVRSSGGEFDYYTINRTAFGAVEEVPYDASGRFILPPFARKRAQLDDLAFFFGARHFFEIWNPAVLAAHPNAHPDAREAAQFLIDERNGK